MRFEREVELPVSPAEAFAWHERPGAFERLLPPWDSTQLVEAVGGIRDGGRVVLRTRVGGFWRRWVARHHGYEQDRVFHDTQVSGPFAQWVHTHRFDPSHEGSGCRLTDSIEYRLPFGVLGAWFGAGFARRKLDRVFRHRHATTYQDLLRHQAFREHVPMKIAVTGAGGLVGRTLIPLLTTGGHTVVKLVREIQLPATSCGTRKPERSTRRRSKGSTPSSIWRARTSPRAVERQSQSRDPPQPRRRDALA
ncbi:MAG: SRPBCC family protein [Pirellulales bacterium]